MLTRVLGIGALAAVVLVAAPSVIVNTVNPAPGATAPPTSASAPAKPAATLKIAVSGERGLVDPLYLRVRAVGVPPAAAHLADDSGAHTASVESAPRHCARLPVHDTFAGPVERDWCLSVTSLDAGHTLTGLVVGGTSLTLSLTRRHSFWSWPIVVLLAGLFAPLLTGLVVVGLKRFAGNAAIAELVAAHPEIVDLGTWAKDREDAGTSFGNVRMEVQKIVRGPAQVVQARHRLADALRQTTLNADHPYVVAAWAEARRSDIRTSDIVDDKAQPKVAAATDYLSHLTQLEADRAALVGLQKALGGVESDHAYDAGVALDRAMEMFKRVSTPADMAGLTAPLVDATAAIEAATQPEPRPVWLDEHMKTVLGNFELCSSGSGGVGHTKHALTADVAGDPKRLSDLLAGIRSVTTSPLDLSGEQLKWDEGVWLGVTVAAAAAALAFAGATVAQKAYFANPAFATGWDYFTLFSAAFASGAAATVLGLFRYWRPQPGTS